MPFDERIEDFFAVADFAVTATWTPSAGGAEQSAKVILDSPDETILGERVMTTEYMITLPRDSFVDLKGGETIGIAGASYKVREVRLLDDGLLKQATLSKL